MKKRKRNFSCGEEKKKSFFFDARARKKLKNFLGGYVLQASPCREGSAHPKSSLWCSRCNLLPL